MEAWPIEISDEENIVRGVCSPYHVKNGKLKADAFKPPVDSDEVSVMRSDWIKGDTCKRHAKNLENPEQKKLYKGLAVLSAKKIRIQGANIFDSRNHFEGHADIKHGYKVIKGEPNDPQITEIMRERNKQLANAANYHPDPDPENHKWHGPALIFTD